MSSFCRNCGTEIKDGALFCPKCGCKVGDNVVKNSNNSKQVVARQSVPVVKQSVSGATGGGTGNSLVLNIVLGILAFAIIGAGALYFAFDGDFDKVKDLLPGHSQTKVATVANDEKKGDAAVVQSKMVTQDDRIEEFVIQKDKLDVEIAGVASEANNYLKGHSDFRSNDAEMLISDAKKTLDKVERAQGELRQLSVRPENQAVKDALLRVLDCEAGRIRGLYKGMLDSKNNGDYMIGFKEGTENAYRYDDENAKFKSLYKK